jgi:hypothetical protein
MLGLLRSPAAERIDFVSIMAYGAGPAFDPAEAFAAYRAAWAGPLLFGIEVAVPTAQPPRADLARARRAIATAAADGRGGVMILGWLGRPAAGLPDGPAIAALACRALRPPCAPGGR